MISIYEPKTARFQKNLQSPCIQRHRCAVSMMVEAVIFFLQSSPDYVGKYETVLTNAHKSGVPLYMCAYTIS